MARFLTLDISGSDVAGGFPGATHFEQQISGASLGGDADWCRLVLFGNRFKLQMHCAFHLADVTSNRVSPASMCILDQCPIDCILCSQIITSIYKIVFV